MAILWVQDESSGWAAARIELGVYAVDTRKQPPVSRAGPNPSGPSLASLVGQRTPGGQERWALSCPASGICVNGEPIWLGLRVLRDHDEIRLPTGERLFFSTERLAEIVPFPGGRRPVHCPRCHKLIEPGQLAVQCPGCQTWHHQTAELPCWTYDARCALCPQPTALDAGLNWTPEHAHA